MTPASPAASEQPLNGRTGTQNGEKWQKYFFWEIFIFLETDYFANVHNVDFSAILNGSLRVGPVRWHVYRLVSLASVSPAELTGRFWVQYPPFLQSFPLLIATFHSRSDTVTICNVKAEIVKLARCCNWSAIFDFIPLSKDSWSLSHKSSHSSKSININLYYRQTKSSTA